MRFTLILALVVLVTLSVTGCTFYRAPVVPPLGGAFNITSAPMDLEYHSTDLGVRHGEASSISVLGLFSFGDSSIAAAAREGRIQTVHHADSKLLNVLVIFVRHTTVVYGT